MAPCMGSSLVQERKKLRWNIFNFDSATTLIVQPMLAEQIKEEKHIFVGKMLVKEKPSIYSTSIHGVLILCMHYAAAVQDLMKNVIRGMVQWCK